MREPRADLPVAVAVGRRGGERRPNHRHRCGVPRRRLLPASPGRWRDGPRQPRSRRTRSSVARATPRRSSSADAADSSPGSSAFHRLCIFHSSVKALLSMRCSASSNLIISSTMFARASVSSRSSGSPRLFNPRGSAEGPSRPGTLLQPLVVLADAQGSRDLPRCGRNTALRQAGEQRVRSWRIRYQPRRDSRTLPGSLSLVGVPDLCRLEASASSSEREVRVDAYSADRARQDRCHRDHLDRVVPSFERYPGRLAHA
jgi:hypothetical protein